MIKYSGAVRTARMLLGTPYKQMDCIALIREVIRRSAGGETGYRCQGTNWLWESVENSAKYRHLIWRQEGLHGARGGMLAFKRQGSDVHHVGLVTGEGTVIHSSSEKGMVVETPLTSREGWTHLARHRYIEAADVAAESAEADMEPYKGLVTLNDPNSTLNVRDEPGTSGRVISKLIDGQRVTVQAEPQDGWLYVTYGDSGVGYVSAAYIAHDDTPEPEEALETTTLVNALTGDTFMLVGKWRVAQD